MMYVSYLQAAIFALASMCIGATLGLFAAGLCRVAAEADRDSEVVYYDNSRYICPTCDEFLTLEESAAKKCRCGVRW